MTMMMMIIIMMVMMMVSVIGLLTRNDRFNDSLFNCDSLMSVNNNNKYNDNQSGLTNIFNDY